MDSRGKRKVDIRKGAYLPAKRNEAKMRRKGAGTSEFKEGRDRGMKVGIRELGVGVGAGAAEAEARDDLRQGWGRL